MLIHTNKKKLKIKEENKIAILFSRIPINKCRRNDGNITQITRVVIVAGRVTNRY